MPAPTSCIASRCLTSSPADFGASKTSRYFGPAIIRCCRPGLTILVSSSGGRAGSLATSAVRRDTSPSRSARPQHARAWRSSGGTPLSTAGCIESPSLGTELGRISCCPQPRRVGWCGLYAQFFRRDRVREACDKITGRARHRPQGSTHSNLRAPRAIGAARRDEYARLWPAACV